MGPYGRPECARGDGMSDQTPGKTAIMHAEAANRRLFARFSASAWGGALTLTLALFCRGIRTFWASSKDAARPPRQRVLIGRQELSRTDMPSQVRPRAKPRSKYKFNFASSIGDPWTS